MKKVMIFLGVVVLLFAALAFVSTAKNKQKAEGNPFGKESLHTATVQQLDDPLYDNVILPDELGDQLSNEENVIVYFYSPTCPACQQATPKVVPLAESLGVDLKLFNLLEFEAGWQTYQIEATPTLVHYEEGKESSRMQGLAEANEYEQWLSQFN